MRLKVCNSIGVRINLTDLFYQKGCFHNRALFGHPYANGYRDSINEFRTIMSYPCKDKNCKRIMRISSSDKLRRYNGIPFGDRNHDNSRRINENRITVANYRTSNDQILMTTTATPSISPTTSPTNPPTRTLEPLKCRMRQSLMEVIVKTHANPQQLSWTLSRNGIQVDSFNRYTQANAVVKHQKCVPAGSCYTFVMNDEGGNNIRNDVFLKITEAGETVLQVDNFNSKREEYSIPVEGTILHKVGPGNSIWKSCKWLSRKGDFKRNKECSRPYIKSVCVNVCNTCTKKTKSETIKNCGEKESLMEVIVKTHANPQQLSWTLSRNGIQVDSFNRYTQANAVVKHQKCVPAGSCYTFVMNDEGGNNIRNDVFLKITEAGETVLQVDNFNSKREEYSIPVEGTLKYKIGWPGMNAQQCKWLKSQSQYKRNLECPQFRSVCVNVCKTCERL